MIVVADGTLVVGGLSCLRRVKCGKQMSNYNNLACAVERGFPAQEVPTTPVRKPVKLTLVEDAVHLDLT